MLGAGIKISHTGRQRILASFALCVIGISANTIGSQLAPLFGLPLYLDSIGTIFATILGGLFPGVVVGYLTNLITTFFDSTALYYGVVNVLIALLVSLWRERGWLRRPAGMLTLVLTLAVVSGALSSTITWWLYGFGFEGGVSTPLAGGIHARLGWDPMAAQMLADVLTDVLDKAASMLLAVGMAALIPEDGRTLFDFSLWHQRPLSEQEVDATRTTHPRIMSLRTKLIFAASLIMAFVGVATIVISYLLFSNLAIKENSETGAGINSLAAQAIDANRVDEFLELGDDAPGYRQTEQRLAQIRDSFDSVEYIYVYRILEDGCHVVLDPDTANEPGSDPGEVIPFDNAFESQKRAFLNGEPIEPTVSNETYGWLLTVYQPLLDDSGRCVAYVGTDILMNQVRSEGYAFLVRVASLSSAFFLLMFSLMLWLSEYAIVLPLNSMASAIEGYVFDDEKDRNAVVARVRSLEIHTGDEIESLYHSVGRMVGDIVSYIKRSQEQAQTIARMQDNLILVMADLVESRDHFTGEHVRKTAAYTKVIMDQMRREGIYDDELTDDFISDVIHSAPLHDIGKIQVSDTVLNKPGRLTDEEFTSMKAHTTAGEHIIESAVDAVSEPTYLDEARRLAGYHHEWWDGSRGYPHGVSGSDIPLSARIMAVADVFDALISKRSYKQGMPIEKAFAIIREESGTHFDPLVAQAFLDAEDEVRKIAEQHGDDKGTQLFDVHEE